MKRPALFLMLAGLCLAADTKADDPAKEVKAFQGSSRIVSGKFGDKSAPWMDSKDARLEIKDQGLLLKGADKQVRRSFGGGPKKNPKRPVLKSTADKDLCKSSAVSLKFELTKVAGQIDLVMPGFPMKIPGIYAFEGDRLNFCVAVLEGKALVRPDKLSSDKGILIVFERVQPGKAIPEDKARAKAIQDVQKQLQGTWKVVKGDFDGGPLTKTDLEGFQLSFSGDQLKWKEAGATESLQIMLDPASTPPALNLVLTEGDRKGRSISACYRLKGDKLTVALPDELRDDRPENLEPNKFARVNVLMLERVKP